MEVTFQVVGQRQTQRLGPDRRVEDGMEITFVSMPSGTYATEFVPMTRYNPAAVATILQERAAAIESIHML